MNSKMPLVVSDSVAALPFIFFGGGHPIMKLRVNVQELIAKSENKVFVADIVYKE